MLLARFETGLPGLNIVPCELIEASGQKLRNLVLRQDDLWKVSPAVRELITSS